MNYELAKQLKEAGFPQGLVNTNYNNPTVDFRYYAPTLEELIDACMPNFKFLGYELGGLRMQWRCMGFSDKESFSIVGKTPSDAVANLWLQLNQKK